MRTTGLSTNVRRIARVNGKMTARAQYNEAMIKTTLANTING
jgi:hypothetical protein